MLENEKHIPALQQWFLPTHAVLDIVTERLVQQVVSTARNSHLAAKSREMQ